MQLLAFTDHEARRWNRNGSAIDSSPSPRNSPWSGRRVLLHLATRSPWTQLAGDAIDRLRALAVPGSVPKAPSRLDPAPVRPVEPAPTRGDTRQTVAPRCHNQTSTAGRPAGTKINTASARDRG
jgi:hypothetical protein